MMQMGPPSYITVRSIPPTSAEFEILSSSPDITGAFPWPPQCPRSVKSQPAGRQYRIGEKAISVMVGRWLPPPLRKTSTAVPSL